MKKLLKVNYFLVALATLMAFGSFDLMAQTRKRPVIRKAPARRTVVPAARFYTVSSGQKMRVRMNDTLNSKTAQVGNTFTATVTEPVYSNGGVLVIPSGSTVSGRVTSVQSARNEGKPGTIDVTFFNVRTPNGARRAINGSLTELYTDDAKSDSEGTAAGNKMKNRKLIFIGGGGAGGAVLGAAVGGGKGALIGGLIGAGAGFLGDRFTKGKEAEVRAGTEFGVYLNQAASFPRYVEPN
jgi:hypothetical protein